MCSCIGSNRRFRGVFLFTLAVFLLSRCDSFSFYTEVDGRGGQALEISPISVTMPVLESFSFAGRGGFPPYSYSADSGTISPDPTDQTRGIYSAPGITGTDTVTIVDSRGNRRSATVNVITVGPLYITPYEIEIMEDRTAVFTAIGGNPGYSFAATAGSITPIAPDKARFTAPGSSGTVTVSVTDALSTTSSATVTVVSTLPLAISPANVTMVVDRSLTFTAYGGDPPYSFSATAGSITQIDDDEARFDAPATPQTVTVDVTDDVGSTASASVAVEAASPLSLSPSVVRLLQNNTITFEAFGGVEPYSFSKVSGIGTIDSLTGVYTAPSSAGGATVQVTDSDTPPATKQSAIEVFEPLEINPRIVTVTAGRSYGFSAGGGIPPYTYDILSGDGSFSGDTYTAGLTPGTAVVQVSDSIGNQDQATVTISPLGPLTVTPTEVTLKLNTGVNFSASGGVSPYTFSIASGYGTIDTGSGEYTAPMIAGNYSVRVTDSASPSPSTCDAAVTVVWSIDTVHSANNAGKDASITLDAGGNPHISYWVEDSKELWYARWTGSDWNCSYVDDTGGAGAFTSLRIDGSGRAHISYYDDSSKDLRYAFWNGSSWVKQTVDSTDNVGKHTSLVLDGGGNPHISYWNESDKDLKVATWDGSSWDIQTVDGPDDVGAYSEIRLDGGGYPHVCYYDSSNKDLKYARWNGSSWSVQTVDGSGGNDRGEHCSLDLDAAGRAHISYYDDDNKDLRYAYWNGSSWARQIVDGPDNVGKHSSLVLDQDDRPYISYWDESNQDLKLAFWNGSSWILQTVDGSPADTGEYSSVVMDAAGRVKIVYYDTSNDDLLFAD
jgi:hypothetical protein